MLSRKNFPDKDPMIGTCQISGDTGMELVKHGKLYVSRVIKAALLREEHRPTDEEKYQDWKSDFDRWTG